MPAKKDSDSSPVKKGARKSKKSDDKVKVKRAPSAYIVFCTEKRAEAKESNPDSTFGELGKILGQMWGQLDDKGKEVCSVRSRTNLSNLKLSIHISY